MKRGGTTAELKAAVEARLLPWFAAHARKMPWRRKRRKAYRVWVSEIMLQQTRVETVVPYFKRFLERFPDARALAAADLQDVLKAWEGLGYYARARQMHKAAQVLAERHGGELPRDAESLRKLPGFGAYTTAAVGSLAFGLDLAVVDGNVERALARVTGYAGETGGGRGRGAMQALADQLLIPGRAGECNEAWMELGALACTPRAPKCGECPLEEICRARREGRPEAYPKRRQKMKVPHKVVGAAVILDAAGRVMIAQRKPEGGMLAGLWEFPGGKRQEGETMEQCIARELREEMGVELEVGRHLTTVNHAYSHFTIELHAHFARIASGEVQHLDCAGHAWVEKDGFDAYPFSKADLEIIRAIRALEGGWPVYAEEFGAGK